jgi:hypothetical protein
MLRVLASQLAGPAAESAAAACGSGLLPQLASCLQSKRRFNFIPYVRAGWRTGRQQILDPRQHKPQPPPITVRRTIFSASLPLPPLLCCCPVPHPPKHTPRSLRAPGGASGRTTSTPACSRSASSASTAPSTTRRQTWSSRSCSTWRASTPSKRWGVCVWTSVRPLCVCP